MRRRVSVPIDDDAHTFAPLTVVQFELGDQVIVVGREDSAHHATAVDESELLGGDCPRLYGEDRSASEQTTRERTAKQRAGNNDGETKFTI